jgi:uncharacterized membrane protein
MIGGSMSNGMMELNLRKKSKLIERHEIFVIMKQVHLINRLLVLPGIIGLLVTGLLITYLSNYPLTIFWVISPLLLMIVVFFLFFIGKKYEDRLKIQAFKNEQSESLYKTHIAITIIGFSASMVILFILYVMIVKPT